MAELLGWPSFSDGRAIQVAELSGWVSVWRRFSHLEAIWCVILQSDPVQVGRCQFGAFWSFGGHLECYPEETRGLTKMLQRDAIQAVWCQFGTRLFILEVIWDSFSDPK